MVRDKQLGRLVVRIPIRKKAKLTQFYRWHSEGQSCLGWVSLRFGLEVVYLTYGPTYHFSGLYCFGFFCWLCWSERSCGDYVLSWPSLVFFIITTASVIDVSMSAQTSGSNVHLYNLDAVFCEWNTILFRIRDASEIAP